MQYQKDEKSRFKLMQLWSIIKFTNPKTRKTYSHNRIVQEILKDDFNINYKVTINPRNRSSKIHLQNCTALHFVYCDYLDIDTFTALLERGADFTLKNDNDQTVLHLNMIKCRTHGNKPEVPFMNATLSAHVKFKNSVNPRDHNGLSHLHGACITNHVQALEFLLDNGASIDEIVNLDAPQFSGYTPLHFAAEFHCFEVIRILIRRGANINNQSGKGRMPLDLLIRNKQKFKFSREKEQIIQLLLENNAISAVGLSSLHLACLFKNMTIAEQLLDAGADINLPVPVQSRINPGNTALHFAADNNIEAVKMLLKRGAKLDVVNVRGLTPLEICTNKYSPQDVCSILSHVDDWKEICLSDGQTKLLDLIKIINDAEQMKLFLKNQVKVVPSYSTLFPSCTLIHLAVIFTKTVYDSESSRMHCEKIIVQECLDYGLDVNTQDIKGKTPIHLAFIQCKDDILNVLLEHLKRLNHITNVTDNDNLSYLHIACAVKDESLVEKLLRNSDLNIAYNGKRTDCRFIEPGSTPLHIAAANGCHTIASILLNHGANLHALDRSGLSPIHWLVKHFSSDDQQIANVLFTSLLVDTKDCVVDGLGLSYLHIACRMGNVNIVEKLLDLGSDVNAVTKYNKHSSNRIMKHTLTHFGLCSKSTPLRMAIKRTPNEQVLDVLLRRGADIFIKRPTSSFGYLRGIPIESKHAVRRFFNVLWDRGDMQQSMEDRIGLTKLHVACYMKNEEAIRSALNYGIDVNSQINADSELFAGCTPLHLLVTIVDSELMFNHMHIPEFMIGVMIKLLLNHGADVTIANAAKDTPIHALFNHIRGFIDNYQCMDLLLNVHQDFTVNPVNMEGMTHFHLACYWHKIEIIEKFLQHGSVDVNQPIDYYARFDAGSTALHLILNTWMGPEGDWTKVLQIVDLLLKHGANVAVKDVNGDTPLHKPAVLRSPLMSILEKLVSFGGDVKTENVRGQTPIEELTNFYRMNMDLSQIYNIFLNYGYKINSWNRINGEGYIGKVFLLHRGDLSQSPEFKEFIESTDVKTIDSEGRTAIHNSVALSIYYPGEIENYIYAVDSFIKKGIDVDKQDNLGQTALHYATRMENIPGIQALLACGADVNIVDNSGKSAFSYAVEHSENKRDLSFYLRLNVTIVLRMHIKKLQHLSIEVSQVNQNLVKAIEYIFDKPRYKQKLVEKGFKNLSEQFLSEIDMTKMMDIGINSLTLFDFLSETGSINLYCLLPKLKRDPVDEFFKPIDYKEFKESSGIIKLQLKKMTKRLAIINSTLNSVRMLLGFSVPGLCEQISRYLSNTDLRHLIESTMSKTNKRKRSISSSN